MTEQIIAIAEDGTPITEEMVARWAQEIEAGHYSFEAVTDEERAKRRRYTTMNVHSIRVTDVVWGLAQEQARSQGVSMSAFVREALIETVARAAEPLLQKA